MIILTNNPDQNFLETSKRINVTINFEDLNLSSSGAYKHYKYKNKNNTVLKILLRFLNITALFHTKELKNWLPSYL